MHVLYEKLTSQENRSLEERKITAETVAKLARELNEQVILVNSLFILGKIANNERNPDNTNKYLKEARSISRNLGDVFLEAETELILSEYYRLMVNKPDSALISAKRASSIGYALNDSILIMNAGFNLVSAYTSLHDPISAIRTAKTTLNYCENNKGMRANIYSQLVIVYRDAGDLRESIKYQELALEIAEESKNYYAIASIHNGMATSKAQLREFETAIEHHKTAIDIYSKMKDSFGIAYSYNMLGTTYLSAKRSSEAMKCFQEAINRFAKIGSHQQMAFAQSNLAMEYMNVGRVDDAKMYVNSAIKNSEFINDKLSMSDAYATAGRYYSIKGMIDRSIVFLMKAVQCAKEINNPIMLQSVYEQLSDSYDRKGDSKNALIFLQLKNAITDTIARQNAQRAYIEMLVKYETGKIKKEATEAKGNLNQLKAETKRNTILLVVVIVVSVTIFSLILFFYWKKISNFFYRYGYLSRKPFNDARNVKAVFSVINKEIPEAIHVDKETSDQLVAKLKKVMDEEKLFLRSDLILSDLAKSLRTNTAYLSRVINDEYEMNFSNFLNKYRIEEAQKLIENRKLEVMTFEGIAKSCGFLSRSSFNQAFKKFTGMTPTEYSQKIDLEKI
ncbi:MAG: tetratricopeptide repeat protein [Bacteroidota bacterium]